MKTLFQPLHSLTHLLDDAADVEVGNQRTGTTHALLSTDLHEEANSFTVSVLVPGMRKEDLSVYIDGKVLVISTKRQPTGREHPGAMTRRYLRYSFILPAGIDTDRMQAKCRNGLLTINLEKKKNKKSHSVIKVLGQENSGKDNSRMNTLWNTIKAKLDARKIVAMRSIKYS